jgi:saccharopine dehydrogenase (NAD+, L-glutamate forming)
VISWVLPSQGKGPVVDPENPGFYVIDFFGKTKGGDKMVARVTGDADPGYGSTSKMLAESAVCLALQDDMLEVEGGFWTPASAMGDYLLQRLQKNAGLTFSITD